MKTKLILAFLLLVSSFLLLPSAFPQGSLTPPPGAPAPTMKTLSEVEPRIAINPTNTPGDASNLFIITQPGSYYLTSETIGASGKNGIRIATSHVTIDLNGYRLAGSAGSLNGIVLPVNGQQNITIRNGFISSWGQLGIDLNLARNCIVRDVQVVDTGANGIHLGDSGVVTGCIANANGGHGFVAGPASVFSSCSARQNGGDGFNASSGSSVSGCAALLNIGRGIFASFCSTVTECSAYDNNGDGISVASGATVSRCSARANGEDGINASVACSIRDNGCTANGQIAGGAGIHVIGGDSRIEGNNCSAQTRGIDVDGSGNIIIRNTCAGNTTNWDIVAANAVAPIVLATNNAAAITGNTYAGSLGSTDPNANFTY
jgi:parallel beta-helix repeat protein